MGRPVTPLRDRFEAKVIPEPMSGCHLWEGAVDGRGYGRVGSGGDRGRTLIASRVAWTLYRGEIPEGLCVLHRCDNPACVNPDHLFLGTQQDNMRDMARKGRARSVPNAPHRRARGESHGAATLTEADVREIRRLRATGVNCVEIARRIGTTAVTARHVSNRYSWRHIP